jgi:hypothetical protein
MSAASLSRIRPRFRLAWHDRVALVLAIAGIAASLFDAFVSIAPNRLADGRPLPLWHLGSAPSAIVFALVALLFVASFIGDERWRVGALFASGAGLLISILLIAGAAADAHSDPQEPARRIALGSAFWALFAVGLLVCFQAL